MKKIVIGFSTLLLVIAAMLGWREYLVSELKKPVLAKLKDPDSAQFRDVRYIGPWNAEYGTICGEVNAKNAMGGYVGYARFSSAYGIVNLASETGEDFVAIYCDKNFEMPWWWLRW